MEDKKIVIIGDDGKPDEKAMFYEKAKEFLKDVGNKAMSVTKETFNFVRDNKETIAFMVPIITGIVAKVGSNSGGGRNYREDSMFYDRSTGTYWQLRRKMTNREMSEYLERRENGEKPDEILYSMRLLK
jgi:hypothetical protein